MLNADLLSGSLKMDMISDFNIKLPNTDSFSSLDLTRDLSSDTEKVEKQEVGRGMNRRVLSLFINEF